MKTRISTIFPLLLITLGCVLAVEGFYHAVEKFLFVPVAETKLVAQVPGKKQTVATLVHTVEDDVRIVLERNLFGPPPSDNKKERSASESLENLQATSLALILLGTVIGEKNESRAIILEKGKKTQDIYQMGEIVQGAILKEIMRGKVILNYNNKDEILDMTAAAKNTQTPPAAVTPGAPPAPAVILRREESLSDPEMLGLEEEPPPDIEQPEEQEIPPDSELQGQEEILTDPELQQQEEISSDPEQTMDGAAPQPPEIPGATEQPRSIRPTRRLNSQPPVKTIQ